MAETFESSIILKILYGTYFKIIETNGILVTASIIKCLPKEVYIKELLTSSFHLNLIKNKTHNTTTQYVVMEEYEQQK